MRILSVKLENYRAFRDLEVDLDRKNCIFVGENGSGKSTVLNAIASVSLPWLRRLNKTQGRTFERLTDADITSGGESMTIGYEVEMNDSVYLLSRSLDRPGFNERAKQTASNGEYNRFSRDFEELYLSPSSRSMPVFVNYGTNRTTARTDRGDREIGKGDMRSALARAADESVDFRRFFDWYFAQEADETVAIRDDRNYQGKALGLVRKVASEMLDGVTDVRVRRSPMRLTATKGGVEVNLDMLSDGERCTLALLGDLVRRLCLANPGLENPLQGEGVVLIDEVDLHLHPAWQRKIVRQLTESFPNVQFILSTHSPQVLSEADGSFGIYLLNIGDGTARELGRMDGLDTNTILDSRLGAESINRKVRKLEASFYDAVKKLDFPAASGLLEDLRSLCGDLSPTYIDAQAQMDWKFR